MSCDHDRSAPFPRKKLLGQTDGRGALCRIAFHNSREGLYLEQSLFRVRHSDAGVVGPEMEGSSNAENSPTRNTSVVYQHFLTPLQNESFLR